MNVFVYASLLYDKGYKLNLFYCFIHAEHFAFDLYDIDQSGIINISEAQFMVKDIYGEEYEHNVHARRACQKLTELDISTIDFPTFSAFVQKHKAILYPAYTLQLNLKKYVMGLKFWHRQAQNRLRISRGMYINAARLLGKKNFGTRKLYKRKPELLTV